ncbi:MAG: DoxX family membrane protein [Flavobacteriales bacterium]|nr:DoxX family membrane protein [Flavobacteriales bacterium]
MKYTATIEGKSLVFNIAFVVVNLTGLGFFVSGNLHPNDLFFYLGIGLMALSTAGMIIFKGRLMMSSVARVLVGGLFIVSGLVKANDPLGFSYKLEEYFQDGALAYRIKELFGAPAFSLEFFMDYALVISIIICIAEIVLGVLTIIGGKIKLVSYLMLGMMLFFTFLTWHTANCDSEAKFLDRDTYVISSAEAAKKLKEAEEGKVKIFLKTSSELVVDEMKTPQCVTDCGCFGDALKGSVGRSLTPQESLWKDLILLYLVIWIFAAQWIIKPNTIQQNLVYTVTSSLVIVFFAWVFGWYFPILFGVIAILGALWVRRIGGKLFGNYWGSALFVTILTFLLVGFVLRYAPLKDYRPYAIGADLNAKLNDGEKGVFEDALLYKNKRTGEERTYLASSNEYTESNIWENNNWEFVSMVNHTVKEPIDASIQDFYPFINTKDLSEAELKLDFVSNKVVESNARYVRVRSVEDEGTKEVLLSKFSTELYPSENYEILDTIEITQVEEKDISVRDDLFSQKRIAILVSRDLTNANWNEIDRIKAIAEQCEKEKVPFVVIANATRQEIDSFRSKNKFNCAVFSMDQIELKIISRSNPALLVLEKGIIKEKYSHRMIPTGDRFKEKHLNN